MRIQLYSLFLRTSGGIQDLLEQGLCRLIGSVGFWQRRRRCRHCATLRRSRYGDDRHATGESTAATWNATENPGSRCTLVLWATATYLRHCGVAPQPLPNDVSGGRRAHPMVYQHFPVPKVRENVPPNPNRTQKLVKTARRGRSGQNFSILPKIRLFRLLKNGFAGFRLYGSFFCVFTSNLRSNPAKNKLKSFGRPAQKQFLF